MPPTESLLPGVDRVLISERVLRHKVSELAGQIRADYQGKRPLLVGLLKGSFMFLADLAREISLDSEVDFMLVSSYGNGQEATEVKILQDLRASIQGQDVLIIEDIIDTGYTLQKICSLLAERQPASLKICTLLNKPSRRRVALNADYCGFDIDDVFVAGYGIDFAQRFRCLPYLVVVKKPG